MHSHLHHTPVLLRECMSLLSPSGGQTVLDVTLGLGGHAEEFLRRTGPDGQFYGVDTDEENLHFATDRLSLYAGRLHLFRANFQHLADIGLPTVDIVFADLGVSSPHFDLPERGFSFRSDAPLDMRFDRSSGATAAEWIASCHVSTLTRTLSKYGELREAARIARHIADALPQTTFALRDAVRKAVGFRADAMLPRVFQAVRMAVNTEIDALESLLAVSPGLVKPGGRIGIISYHSLEDRLVKNVFRKLCTAPVDERTGQDLAPAEWSSLTKKCVVPTPQEIEENPRARSAKFRVIQKNVHI
ncbi:16S rRNA (cytosine(1402)-N(4))-methyltransferase RsmH [Candidatus Peregrinibacteria bacterium]|nr:16S rRNA (cytosine(1402)-N(4))-methyltransferase RsmH [Candidatus Peregrinibacteria bacterium]